MHLGARAPPQTLGQWARGTSPCCPWKCLGRLGGKKGIHPPSLLDPGDQKVLENPTVMVPWQSWQPHVGQEGCPIRGTLGQHVGKMQPLDIKDKDLQAGLGIKSRENLRELMFSKTRWFLAAKTNKILGQKLDPRACAA